MIGLFAMPTILLLLNEDAVASEILAEIRSIAPDYDLWTTKTPAQEDPDRIRDVVISAGGRPPEEVLKAPNLKWHHQQSAGVDWLFRVEDRTSLPFTITNVSGMHAPQITELTFAMILTFARDMLKAHKQKEEKEWSKPRPERLFNLPGKTMLILGVGAIGSNVAKVAKAHGMRVLGIRRQPEKSDPCVDRMGSLEDLNRMLPEADIVVSILPRSPHTENILGAEQFASMKTSSIFINVGRGSHVDEDALIEALSTGSIAGAGLDTFAQEPLPRDSQLWELENVIISPHIGGMTKDYANKSLQYFIRNLKRYLSGEPLFNIVDKKLGY